MAKTRYVVYATRPNNFSDWPWPLNFFPRKFHYLKYAKEMIRQVLARGATGVTLEKPDGSKCEYKN